MKKNLDTYLDIEDMISSSKKNSAFGSEREFGYLLTMKT